MEALSWVGNIEPYLGPLAVGASAAFLTCVSYDLVKVLMPQGVAVTHANWKETQRRKRWVKQFTAQLLTDALEEAHHKERLTREEVTEMYNFIGTRCKGMSDLLPARYRFVFPDAKKLKEAIHSRIRRKSRPVNKIAAVLFGKSK